MGIPQRIDQTIAFPVKVNQRETAIFLVGYGEDRELGPENVALTTDLGQLLYPVHTDGFAVFIDRFREAGFSIWLTNLPPKLRPTSACTVTRCFQRHSPFAVQPQ